MYSNEISGIVYGLAIQVGQITITSCPPVTDSPRPLIRALNDATVVFESPAGTGRGVCVGPDLVLTLAELVPEATPVPGHPDLVLVERRVDDKLFACIGLEQPIGTFRTVLEPVPGSPVLNQLTGEVCALVTGPNSTTPVPELHLDPDPRWLDLLTPEQLLTSRRRHLKPVLRQYLTAVRALGQQHEYELAENAAPDLQTIYLERWADNGTDEEESDLPETIDADQLLTDYPNSQVIAEPGVGKSSLLRHFAAQTADAWLSRRGSTVVPVPITADAFRGRLLPELLANGVQSDLDLTRQQLVDLFSGEPLPGVRWLILVDGLDEVIDPSERSAVLRRIGRLRRDPKYLIALTSRHLEPADIKRFHENGHPTYVLTPFRKEDLEQFVSKWLQRAKRPDAEAADLIARLRESKLDELVYVPLIATMVCALHCSSPERELPRDQTELYRRFVEWQLSKVSQHDLGHRLRQWQKKSGLSAEQAAAQIRDRLEPLLRDLAFGLLTVSPKPDVLAYVTSRHPGIDSGALEEALRMSGLIVTRGQELVFRHRTIVEYLAACHVLAVYPKPQHLLEPSWANRWEWPDLGMKVFIAALLINNGVDIRRQLRHLMWPTFRKQHIGFLAALVRHGVEVDEKVLSKAVRLLTRTVRSPKTRAEWQAHVQWLHEIDTDATADVLRSMVVDPGKISENRHFEAVRYLIGMDPFGNVDFVVTYLMNPSIQPIARNSVNKLLADVDVKLAVQIFARLAVEAHEPSLRLQGAEFVLSYNVDRGLELCTHIARHTSTGDEIRISAIKLASGHDRALGFVLWGEFMVTARHEESRTHAMELLYEHDPEATVKKLHQARNNKKMPNARRHEFGFFLVRRAGHDPRILIETARHHDVPSEQRVQAALLNRTTDPAGATEVLQDVVQRRRSGERDLLRNIEHLRSMNEAKGVEALVTVAKDRQETEDLRMKAAEQLPGLEAREVYDHLVDDGTLSDASNLVAARSVLKLDRSRGIESLVRLAGHSHVATQVRLEAAHGARFQDSDAGFRGYAAIVNDRSVVDTLRVRAAVEAKKASRGRGNKLLQSLSREGLDGDAQLAVAEAMGGQDAERLLHRIAASSLPVHHRMTAAARLVPLCGHEAAALAYQSIADSKGVSQHQRLLAQREADQLREP